MGKTWKDNKSFKQNKDKGRSFKMAPYSRNNKRDRDETYRK